MDAMATQLWRKHRSEEAGPLSYEESPRARRPGQKLPILPCHSIMPVTCEHTQDVSLVLGAGLGDTTETRPLPLREKLKYVEKDFSLLPFPHSLALPPCSAEVGTQGNGQLAVQSEERALVLCK